MGYALVDTISVDDKGAVTTGSHTLQSQADYLIVASGTTTIDSKGRIGNAYNWQLDQRGRPYTMSPRTSYGLAISTSGSAPAKPDWMADVALLSLMGEPPRTPGTQTSTFVIQTTGAGEPARFQFLDTPYDDNGGRRFTVKIFARVIADATFDVLENSPNGTLVGSVGSSIYQSYVLTSPFFAIDDTGNITVENNQYLDYETPGTRVQTYDVVAFKGYGQSDVLKVTINIINVNERPVLVDSGNYMVGPLLAVHILYKDPEGDNLTSATANGKSFEIKNGDTVVWYPSDVTPQNVFSTRIFELTVSDGQLQATNNIIVNVQSQSYLDAFVFGVGEPANKKLVETEPGASGDITKVDDPSYMWKTQSPTVTDYTILRSARFFAENSWQSEQAKSMMKHYFDGQGIDYTYDIDSMLADSPSAAGWYFSEWQILSAWLESKSFEGTIDVYSRSAHLGMADGVHGPAVGEYTGWSTSQIVANKSSGQFSFSASLRYHLWDPYDWNPYKEDWKQRDLARLHIVGLAKQFMTIGVSSPEQHNWTKGGFSIPGLPGQ